MNLYPDGNYIVVDEHDFVFRRKSRSIDKTLEWALQKPGKRSIFRMKKGFRLPATINELEKVLSKLIYNIVDDVVNNHGI